ncbi:MAG: hypothetical protein IT373_23785 [Polyangiaceae bacterium]|nr:hypothetical protein [Polyangiaceae bacterium]
MNAMRHSAMLGLLVALAGCGGAKDSQPTTPKTPSGSSVDATAKQKGDGGEAEAAVGGEGQPPVVMDAAREASRGPGSPESSHAGSGEPAAAHAEPAPKVELAQPIAMPTPAAYRSGEVLAYLPKDCDERVFANVGAMIPADAAAAVGAAALRVLGMKSKEAAVAIAGALRTARDAGFDPFTQTREIAVCGDGDVVAVGLALDKGVDLAATLQRVMVAVGERAGEVVREGSVNVLRNDSGGALAQVNGNVLVIADREADLRPAIAGKAGAAGFGDVSKHLVLVRNREVGVDVLGKGGNLDVSVAVHLSDGDAREAQAHGKEFMAEASQILTKVAEQMEATPAKPLAARVRAIRPQLRGKDLVFQGSTPVSELQAVLKGIVSMKPEDLARMMPR